MIVSWDEHQILWVSCSIFRKSITINKISRTFFVFFLLVCFWVCVISTRNGDDSNHLMMMVFHSILTNYDSSNVIFVTHHHEKCRKWRMRKRDDFLHSPQIYLETTFNFATSIQWNIDKANQIWKSGKRQPKYKRWTRLLNVVFRLGRIRTSMTCCMVTAICKWKHFVKNKICPIWKITRNIPDTVQSNLNLVCSGFYFWLTTNKLNISCIHRRWHLFDHVHKYIC